MLDNHNWAVSPIVSAQLATFDDEHLKDGVCIHVQDRETREVILEMIFPDMEVLEQATELLAHFARIGRYMHEHGYDQATRHFGLDSNELNPQQIAAELDRAILQILDEGARGE